MGQFNLMKAESTLALAKGLAPGLAKNSISKEDYLFIKDLDDAGSAYHAHGCYIEAESCYTKVLDVKKSHGMQDESTLGTVHRLAIIYRLQRKYPEAEKAHLEAVEIARALFGVNHLKVAEQELYLAGLYESFGRSHEALSAMNAALKIYESLQGPDSVDVGICHFALALIYIKMGSNPAEAAEHYARSHAIAAKHMFGQNETIANGLFGMAMYHFRQKDFENAESLLRHSIILREESLWPFHPLVPKTLLKLGDFYDNQQLPDKAELCYLSALQKQQVVFGDEHPSLVDALTRLAKFYSSHGDDEKAKDYGRRIILLQDA